MGGIFLKYAVEISECYDIHTKFYKDWFGDSNVNGGRGIHRRIDRRTDTKAAW
jgi:hypothetical protein